MLESQLHRDVGGGGGGGFLATVFGGGASSLAAADDRRRTGWRARSSRLSGRDAADDVGRLRRRPSGTASRVEEAHHALDDAVMTAELFLVLATKLAARGDERMKTLRRAARAGRSAPRIASEF